MIEGINEDMMATTMIAAASVITLGLVLFVGLKLRWFRARMRFDTNNASRSYSSVASASAPMTSVVGTYRPNKEYGFAHNHLNSAAPGVMPKPEHHRSMSSLSKSSTVRNENSDKLRADISKSLNSLTAVSTHTKDVTANSKEQKSVVLSSTPGSTTSTNLNVTSTNREVQQYSETDIRYEENGDIHSNRTADVGQSNVSKKQKKKNKNKTTETMDTDSGNLVFLDSQRSPINLSEYKVPETLPRKGKGKAPAAPTPIPKFHEYEEFES